MNELKCRIFYTLWSFLLTWIVLDKEFLSINRWLFNHEQFVLINVWEGSEVFFKFSFFFTFVWMFPFILKQLNWFLLSSLFLKIQIKLNFVFNIWVVIYCISNFLFLILLNETFFIDRSLFFVVEQTEMNFLVNYLDYCLVFYGNWILFNLFLICLSLFNLFNFFSLLIFIDFSLKQRCYFIVFVSFVFYFKFSIEFFIFVVCIFELILLISLISRHYLLRS